MANLPYITNNPNKIFSALKMYSRTGQFPLDPTSVFNTYADLVTYCTEAGTYAYPGQVVAVANNTLAASSPSDESVDFTLYVIKKDMTPQEIGRDIVFESKSAAEEYVTLNTDYVKPGSIFSVKKSGGDDAYELYILNSAKTLIRVSFDSGDIPEVTWEALTGKPNSSVTDIDGAVTLYKKLSETVDHLAYNSKELAFKEDLTWDNITEKPAFDTLYAAKSHTHEAADITSIDFDSTTVTGTLPLDAIPAGAKEEVFTADNLAALATPEWISGKSIQKNDWISVAEVEDPGTKVKSAKMYYVTDPTKLGTADYADGIKEIPLGTAAAVAWANVTGKPNFDTTYVKNADLIDTSAGAADVGKVMKLNSDGKLGASITGDAQTLDGHAAEYFSVDGHTHAFSEITGNLAWEKLTDIPTTVSEMGLTDAITDSDVVATSSGASDSGKIPALDSNGKLPFSITGDADTVDGKHATDFATSDHNHALDSLTGTLNWGKLSNVPTTASVMGLTDVITDDDVVAASTGSTDSGKLLKLNADGKLDAGITGSAAFLEDHPAAYFAEADHTHAMSEITGDLPFSRIEAATKPTTLDGYGITDAVGSDLLVTTSEGASSSGKIMTLNGDGKLAADITGSAAKLENHPASYFAVSVHDHTTDQITGLDTQLAGIIGSALTGSTITHIDLSSTTLMGKISLDNLPAGAMERMIVKASVEEMLQLTQDEVQNGDLIKIAAVKPEDQKVYYVKDDTQLSSLTNGYEEFPMGTAAAVAWEGVTGKPDFAALYAAKEHTHTAADVGAVPATDVVTAATADKILKLDGDGKLPADITGDAATLGGHAASYFSVSTHTHAFADITGLLDWSKLTNVPTTAAAMGLTDVVLDSDVVAASTGATDAGKIASLNEDGKLEFDLAGDAATVGGKAASDFAEATHTHTNTEITDFAEGVNGLIDSALAETGVVVIGTDAPESHLGLESKNLYIQLL